MPHSELGERLKVAFHISTRWGIGPSTACFIRSGFCYLYDEGTELDQGHSVFIYLFMPCSEANCYSQAAYRDKFYEFPPMALNITAVLWCICFFYTSIAHYFYHLSISFKHYLSLRLIEAKIKEDHNSCPLFVIHVGLKAATVNPLSCC